MSVRMTTHSVPSMSVQRYMITLKAACTLPCGTDRRMCAVRILHAACVRLARRMHAECHDACALHLCCIARMPRARPMHGAVLHVCCMCACMLWMLHKHCSSFVPSEMPASFCSPLSRPMAAWIVFMAYTLMAYAIMAYIGMAYTCMVTELYIREKESCCC